MTITYKIEENEIYGPKGDRIKVTVARGKLPYFLKERKPPRDLSPEVYQFIYDFLPEFDRIWKAVKALPGSLSRNERKNQKQAALQCFDTHKRPRWRCVTRTALESGAPWLKWREGEEKGDFRGKLLQKLVYEHFWDLPIYGWELLEKVAGELETTKK